MVLPAHSGGMRRSALRIAAIYACMAFAWITLSDRVIAALVRDVPTVTHIQTFKGAIFVVVTTVVLWKLINVDMRRLLASEQRYRMLFEASSDAIFVVNQNGQYVDANRAALTLSGRSLAELRAHHVANLITGLDSPGAGAAGPLADLAADPTPREHSLQTPDGRLVPIEMTIGATLVDEQLAFVYIVRDVTAARLALTALRQSEARFRALFEVAPVAIATARQGLTMSANQAYLKLFGYDTVEQLANTPITNQLAPDVRAEVIDRNQRREAGANETAAYETVGLRKNGTTFPLFLDVSLVDQDEEIFSLVFAADISQRKDAEKQLRQQTEQATVLAEVSRTLAEAGLDHQGVLSTITRRTAELVGDACAIQLLSDDQQSLELAASYHPDPALNQSLVELALAAPHHINEGMTGQVARSGQPIVASNFDWHEKQSALRPERWQYFERLQPHSALLVPLRVHGRVTGVMTLLRGGIQTPYNSHDQQFVQELADRAALAVENTRLFYANQQELGERRRAEAALRESEERLRTVVNTAPIALFAVNHEGIFTLSEGKGLEAAGLEPGEVMGQSIFQVYQDAPNILRAVRRALAGETHTSIDHIHNHTLETHWTPIRGGQREASGAIGVALDVTERTRAQAAQQQLISLVENSSDIIGTCALDGQIQYLNSAGQQLLGLANDDAVRSTTIAEYFTAADFARFREEIVPAIVSNGRWFGEFQVKHFSSDALIPIELNAFLLHDQHTGEPIAFANVSRDISARKRAEAELREAYAREQAIIHGVGDPMFLKDREGRYLLVNQAAAQIAGLVPDDIVGRFDRDFFEPNVAVQMREADHLVMTSGQPVEQEETGGLAGAERTMLVVKTPYLDAAGTVQGVIGIARDITERKQAEETLRQSEATQRALINAIPDLMFRFSREGVFLAFEAANNAELASPPSFFIGKHISEVMPPTVAQQATEQIARVLRTGEMQVFEYEHLLSTGNIGVFEARFVQCDTDQVLAIVRDITERKQMERILRESEARQHAILHGTTDAVYLKDHNGRYLLVNPAVEAILQRSAVELVDQTDWDLFSPAEAEAFRQIDQQVMATGQSVEVEDRAVVNGHERTFLTIKAPYRDVDGTIHGVIGVGRDITERKRQEQIKDDFLALASHELKTPLAALVGYIHLLQRWSQKQGGDPRVSKALAAMQHEGSRLDRLINDLLDVSRIQTGRLQLHPRPLDIRSFLASIIETLQLTISDHSIILDAPESSAQISGDPQRLEQVFSNLLTNAAKYSYEAAPIYVTLVVEQNFVEIVVRDTGLGIPATDVPFIFDRFYQVQRPTRESRPGMGLGLFITHEIVQQHGGTINVESWEQGGSRFAVRLPCTSNTSPEMTHDTPSTICPTA